MLKILAPVAVVAVGLAGAVALVRSKVPVESFRPEPETPLVQVATVRVEEHTMMVSARGTVTPRTETALAAQVAAEVIAVSPHFEVGGFFKRGEVLVRLDQRDYELTAERAAARVAQAELRLAQQQAEARVATDEWRQLGDGEPDPLVLRKPQLAEAQAALKAAKAEYGLARLDLERALIRAPFDGRVRSKQADVGQYLTPGQEIAAIHSIDYAEVRLPVPDHQLAFLDLPLGYHNGAGAPYSGMLDDPSRDTEGPEVTLSAKFAGRHYHWPGRVVRAEGELDPRSRVHHLVVQVEDPYGQKGPGRPPLAVGLFVDAEIAGRTVNGTLLPRSALHSGERVLVADGDDDAGQTAAGISKLGWRQVDVVRIDQESVLISGGLQAGERVCVSALDIVVDGMEVRTLEEEGPAIPIDSVEPSAGDGGTDAEELAEEPPTTVADMTTADMTATDITAAEAQPPAQERARTTHAIDGRLLVVSLLEGGTDGATVAATVAGQFSYSTSRLESPERFVVDLIGVAKAEPRSAFELAAGPLERIRIAQFQTEPEPITRIVFDLRTQTLPSPSATVTPTDQGLTITF